MKKTLSVAAIENGTVIDHITVGQGMRIVRLLRLAGHKHQVTLGLNLPSKSMGYKDLIKVEGRVITAEEANQIAVFAPKAKINIINDFQVVKKFPVELPESVKKMLCCPNPRCITNHDPMDTLFSVRRFGEGVELLCNYCEKSFSHEVC
ncbi:MAG: Aspartate carbamoyltransferase regulatory chain [Chlamydiae bacterium]|nr:Aspartate carbamoyltransferase regulatory chain [Chlamydiota bacterium]